MRTKVKAALQLKNYDSEIQVAGWVRTRRDSKGGFSFIEINDGSCFANLQIIADNKLSNYEAEIQKLYTGSSISVRGILKKSQGQQEVEVQALEVKVLGTCPAKEYPLGKQRISFETLRDYCHLRTRTNSFGAVTRVRNALSHAIHTFFQDRGFLYINTPIITASDCEGAGEMFQVTTLDIAGQKPGQPVDYSKDFFGRPSYLTVSGQLEVESYACSLGDVYTFGPTFRAENSHTSRHLAEFWMVEPEMAFADLEDDMKVAESFIQDLFKHILDNCGDDMDFFNDRIDKTVIQTLESIAKSKFKILTYTEAVAILDKCGESFEFPVKWGVDLQSEHERYLTEKEFNGPIIVIDYPKDIKAFYMKLNEDGKTVRAMDVLLPKIGEIIGGSQREESVEVLESRMKASGIAPEHMSWYLDLRRFGSVPHSGFGLGFERLVQFTTGMANIRDVIPFPRTPGGFKI